MYLAVVHVEPLPDYHLKLTFKNGEIRVFDMNPYLNMGIFNELKNVSMFNTVRVSFDTIEWENGAELDPETLFEESISVENQLASEPEAEYKITNMETISIQINNPKAMQLIKNLADLKLITIQPKKVDFWETMTDHQQMEVEKSLLEIEKGEIVDYEAVMSKHRK